MLTTIPSQPTPSVSKRLVFSALTARDSDSESNSDETGLRELCSLRRQDSVTRDDDGDNDVPVAELFSL